MEAPQTRRRAARRLRVARGSPRPPPASSGPDLREHLRRNLDLADVVQRRGPAEQRGSAPRSQPSSQRHGLGEGRRRGRRGRAGRSRSSSAREIETSIAGTDSPRRATPAFPDPSDRVVPSPRARAAAAPSVLDRAQQAVVFVAAEPRARLTAARARAPRPVRRRPRRSPLVEDDEDDAAARAAGERSSGTMCAFSQHRRSRPSSRACRRRGSG